MMQDVDQEMEDKAEKELEAKLQKYVDAYDKSQRLLKILKKYKEKWVKKMVDVKAKDEEISSKEKYLDESLDAPPSQGGVRAYR